MRADLGESWPEGSAVETMAAPRTPGDYGGGGEHGGRSRRLHSNRRRVVGLLCFVLSLVELGGLLIKVYLLLTNTSFVENPPYSIAYNSLANFLTKKVQVARGLFAVAVIC